MIDALVARGEIGGKTVQVVDTGGVECAVYPVPRPRPGQVLVSSVRTAISPGTEMTFYGRATTNVYLHKRWDPELRLFRPGSPTLGYPLTFGYRASGEVVESLADGIAAGTRVFGTWRHTEYTLLDGSVAAASILPDGLSHDDGVDIGQMGPICLNAVAHAEGAHEARAVVVFGAGPIGLITAQLARATGAGEVYVVDRLPSRLAIAESLGLGAVAAGGDADVAYELKRRLGADAIPVAFECTGSPAALNEAIRTVARRGLVVAVGFYQGEARGLVLGDEFHHNAVRLVCSQIGSVHPAWNLARLRQETITFALSGRLALGGLPRLTLPVERAADGFVALQRPDQLLQVALSYGTT